MFFFGNPDDYRTSWVTELGINILTLTDLQRPGKINWNPDPVSFEERKIEITNEFNTMVKRAIHREDIIGSCKGNNNI